MISISQEKIFDPFALATDTNDSSLAYDAYEKLRVACSFHSPTDMSNFIANNTNKLNIIHINARSIVNKHDDLCTLLVQTAITWHIISISETWLTKPIENQYNIPGFHAFYCSRDIGAGGGSALYIADHLHPEQIYNPIFTTAEVVCATIKLNNNTTIIICQIYRSPSSDKCQFNAELEQCLIWLSKMNKVAFVTGDFNFDLFSIDSNTSVQTFFTNMLSHGFFPTISKTTRSAYPSCTLLDNIFCNELSRVVRSGILLNDLSDHFPVFSSYAYNSNHSNSHTHTTTTAHVFNYKRLGEFKQFITQSLVNIEVELSPDHIANKIIQVYNEGITKFSYLRRSSRKNSPRKPWISPGILLSIAHKDKLFKDKLKNPSSYYITQYNQYKNILTKLIRSAKKKHYQHEFAINAGNSKETWKTLQTLIKSKQKTDNAPTKIVAGNGASVTNDTEIAETFNSFFTEIGEKLSNTIPKSTLNPLELIPDIANEMNLESTSEQELINIINGLNNVGAGVDNISAKLFKLSFSVILKPLLHLFNSCLQSGTFPLCLKIAVIKPIFKSGECHLVNNYRPISILPFMSKILEKLIYIRLINHLNINKIIHENQFGFQKNKATYMPILLLQDTITKAFEEGEFALGLYIDIKKAFDTVNIELLLKKLFKYGVRHKSHNIISSYLSERTQCVKIRNTVSAYKEVTMGVPQGSILGPILFILYINDLPNISNDMTCLSYADDTAIIFKNKCITHLQLTVNTLLLSITDWFCANFLSLNISKTYTQHYTTCSSDFKLDVKLNNTPVEEKANIKYLGIEIDKSLKFTTHIDHISSIMSRNIGIIARIRYCIDKRTAHILYNSLILPYLNYCCMIWGINYSSQLNKIVILQKRAVRLIEYVYPPHSSEPIFKQYNILKLPDIAKSQMLTVMHKFITKQLPTAFDIIYALYETSSPYRRQIKHLKQPFSNRNYRLFTTSCLGPKLWNEIIAPKFPNLYDIPSSKIIIKRVVRKYFVDTYNV